MSILLLLEMRLLPLQFMGLSSQMVESSFGSFCLWTILHGCCSGLCLVTGGGARVVSCHGQLLVTVVTQPCSPPHSLFVMLHTSHFISGAWLLAADCDYTHNHTHNAATPHNNWPEYIANKCLHKQGRVAAAALHWPFGKTLLILMPSLWYFNSFSSVIWSVQSWKLKAFCQPV